MYVAQFSPPKNGFLFFGGGRKGQSYRLFASFIIYLSQPQTPASFFKCSLPILGRYLVWPLVVTCWVVYLPLGPISIVRCGRSPGDRQCHQDHVMVRHRTVHVHCEGRVWGRPHFPLLPWLSISHYTTSKGVGTYQSSLKNLRRCWVVYTAAMQTTWNKILDIPSLRHPLASLSLGIFFCWSVSFHVAWPIHLFASHLSFLCFLCSQLPVRFVCRID